MQFGIFTVGDVTTDPTTGHTPSEHERIKATVAKDDPDYPWIKAGTVTSSISVTTKVADAIGVVPAG